MKKVVKKKKTGEIDEDIDDFADEAIENKMKELNMAEDIDEDDDFDEFLKGELEQEEGSQLDEDE